VGADAEVHIGTNNPKVMVANASNESAKVQDQPLWLVLGEELGHALGIFDGASAPSNQNGINTYLGPDGRGHWEKQSLEELENHGIGGFARPGNLKRSSYPTENSIRAEHHLPARVAYDIVPGASGDHDCN
jgi:hypothetical protein